MTSRTYDKANTARPTTAGRRLLLGLVLACCFLARIGGVGTAAAGTPPVVETTEATPCPVGTDCMGEDDEPGFWRPFLGATALVGMPQDQLADHIRSPGLGFDIYGGVELGESGVGLGADLGWVWYDADGPESGVAEVSQRHRILLAHLVLRYRLELGPFHPYAEGLFGLKRFATSTVIDTGADEEERTLDHSDVAMSYGFGGGFAVQFNEFAYVNLGARYLFGSEAEYQTADPSDRFGSFSHRSRTDLLVLQVGIGGQF